MCNQFHLRWPFYGANVFRFTDAGNVDTSFAGGAGVVTGTYEGSTMNSFTQVVLPPGGIIAAGSALITGGIQVTPVARFTSAGNVSTSYNGLGYHVLGLSGGLVLGGMARQGAEVIVNGTTTP